MFCSWRRSLRRCVLCVGSSYPPARAVGGGNSGGVGGLGRDAGGVRVGSRAGGAGAVGVAAVGCPGGVQSGRGDLIGRGVALDPGVALPLPHSLVTRNSSPVTANRPTSPRAPAYAADTHPRPCPGTRT